MHTFCSGLKSMPGRYFIYDSYSVPIYTFLLTYLLTLSSSVLRYLVYLGTWFASASVPTFVSWIDGVTCRA